MLQGETERGGPVLHADMQLSCSSSFKCRIITIFGACHGDETNNNQNGILAYYRNTSQFADSQESHVPTGSMAAPSYCCRASGRSI